MAMLNGFELWFVKCNPLRPSPQFNPANPSWEVQVRTSELAKKKEAEALGVKMKLIVYPAGHDQEGEAVLNEDGKKTYRVNFSKRSLKKNKQTNEMEPAVPVEVVDGNLRPLDPDTIGHGSIGNIRIMQREYVSGGVQKIAHTLVGIQVTTLILYENKNREEFDRTEMHVIAPEKDENEEPQDDEDNFSSNVKTPSVSAPSVAPETSSASTTPNVSAVNVGVVDGF
jgi:hypothetical protein